MSTLLPCLSLQSKKNLSNNGVNIQSTPIKFNYPSFCKILDVNLISTLIKNQPSFLNQNLDDIIEKEIFNLFMKANLLSLFITLNNEVITNQLAELITAQKNLKYLNINITCDITETTISYLANLSKSITKIL